MSTKTKRKARKAVRKTVEATEEGARTAARETQGLIGTIIVRATRAWRSLRRRLDDLVEKGKRRQHSV